MRLTRHTPPPYPKKLFFSNRYSYFSYCGYYVLLLLLLLFLLYFYVHFYYSCFFFYDDFRVLYGLCVTRISVLIGVVNVRYRRVQTAFHGKYCPNEMRQARARVVRRHATTIKS